MAQIVDRDAPKSMPVANVYTVMVVVACLALATTLGFVMMNLTNSPEKGGYGLEFGQMFDRPAEITPKELPKRVDPSRKGPGAVPGAGGP